VEYSIIYQLSSFRIDGKWLTDNSYWFWYESVQTGRSLLRMVVIFVRLITILTVSFDKIDTVYYFQ